MTKSHFSRITLIILTGLVLGVSSPAQNRTDPASVRIPWKEFRALLELDRDEFVLSWPEFQKILKQTGFRHVPPFQLKDEKDVLTRAQFKNLIDRMQPPANPVVAPPAEYLLTEAAYTGRIHSGSARFRGDFDIEIFDRPTDRYIRIPLFPVHLALENARFDTRPALVVLEGNRHVLTTRSVGRHHLSVGFSLKTSDRPGPQTLSFPIPRTAVTRLEVEIPAVGIAVEVTNAQRLDITEKKGVTRVRALLSPSDSVQLRWRKKPAEIIKGPAKIYAESNSLISLEEDALRVHAAISLSILQNTISTVTLMIPAGTSILDARGNGVEDWRETTLEGLPILEITLDSPKQGRLELAVTAERMLSEAGSAIEFSGFAVRNAIRDKGYLGITLGGASEVTPIESPGLDRLDISELPASLIGRSEKPLLLGYRYLRPPFSLTMEIENPAPLPVIGTVADSASGVTLFTEDGKLVHRIVYRIRNTSKQFLELEIPSPARIWSVFVGGAPVKPRQRDGRILIPLNRSKQGAGGLAAFEVELIYYRKIGRFEGMGGKETWFPVPDIVVSELLWSVYLPEGYRYHSFGGAVERERTARGIRALMAGKGRPISAAPAPPESPEEDKTAKAEIRREADRLKKQFSANLALSEEQMIRQIENEARFSGRVTTAPEGATRPGGVLPIRIRIPATGRLFRFAKTIVSGETLNLRVSYVSESMFKGLGVGLAAMIALAVYLLRRRLTRLGAAAFKRMGLRKR